MVLVFAMPPLSLWQTAELPIKTVLPSIIPLVLELDSRGLKWTSQGSYGDDK